MPIERTDEGHWVVVDDTLRTPWVKENRRLDFDHLLPAICRFLRPGDTVIDVGANIGDHTVAYRTLVTQTGRVIAFEPDPECYACCVLNCGTFQDIHCAAALDKKRNVGIQTVANRGENFVNLDGQGVDGFPIDDLHLLACKLLKVDVEGAELMVLKGAFDTLTKFRPIIVCELVEAQLARFSHSTTDVKSFLSSLGYEGRPLVPGHDRDWLFTHAVG
jgi:FkbM family methyltransferase